MSEKHIQHVQLVNWRKTGETKVFGNPHFAGLKKLDRSLIEYLMLRIRNGERPELFLSAWIDRSLGHISIRLETPDEPEAKAVDLEKFMV